MPANDFEPEQVTVPARTRWTGNKTDQTFRPAPGNTIAIVYIEAKENLQTINAALNSIEGLAVTFEKRTWTAAAIPDRIPEVGIEITVRKHAYPG